MRTCEKRSGSCSRSVQRRIETGPEACEGAPHTEGKMRRRMNWRKKQQMWMDAGQMEAAEALNIKQSRRNMFVLGMRRIFMCRSGLGQTEM